MVETSAIAGATPTAVEISPAGDLLVRWARIGIDDAKAEHVSLYTLEWLRRHDYSNGVRRERDQPMLWDASDANDLPRGGHGVRARR